MSKLLVLLLLLLAAAPGAAQDRFSFVVLGDRTGRARDSTFRLILDEVRLLEPDFIVNTGDLIEGYTSPDSASAQWDTVLGLLAATGIPLHPCPGNHDIVDAASESIYVARLGGPDRSFQFGNACFIMLDNSRARDFGRLDEARRRWLRGELGRSRRFEHAFVLMHRPFWRYALEQGFPDTLHDWFCGAGIEAVFTGHDHFYCSHQRDGVRYFQVGPSGSRYKVHDDPALGAFQNYLFCQVDGSELTVTVIEPGAIRSPDAVTWDAVGLLERAKREAVRLEPLAARAGSAIEQKRALVLRDIAGLAQSGRLEWRTEGTGWQVKPAAMQFQCTANGSCRYEFDFRLPETSAFYPLPRYALDYRVAQGRRTGLTNLLPTRRATEAIVVDEPPAVDGKLDDACWRAWPNVTSFGSRTGEACPVERTRLWFGFDSSRLYLAARCRESRPDLIRASERERDDKVYEDDHLNIVLAPPGSDAYYQLFVNAAGAIADRSCRLTETGESERDYSWNGDWSVAAGRDEEGWTVELSCPLDDLGAGAGDWRINVVRFQSRIDDIGVWQVPFQHDPATFGTLAR